MSEFTPLAGKIALVTGATRGIGKGIALQLGQNGATVYITGRTLTGPNGSLEDTAKEVEARGGKCIPIQCDHSKDEEIEQLFERIKKEQDGQLDLLVNNAYSGVKPITEAMEKGVRFWEQDVDSWDIINNVGLRNHFHCSVYAARMMVPRRQGLIVNISSGGGLRYLFNVCYGVGKQALDRMAADCAKELRKENVACVSLWPGAVMTETIAEKIAKDGDRVDPSTGIRMNKLFDKAETVEYSGKAIVYLAKDPNVMKKSGRILYTSDLGDEYGFVDTTGLQVDSFRTVRKSLEMRGYTGIAAYIPRWVKIPHWMIAIAGSKF